MSFEKVKWFIAETNNLKTENLDFSELEETWKKNKARFIERWGGTRLVSKEKITFTISQEEFDKRIELFSSSIENYISDKTTLDGLKKYVVSNSYGILTNKTTVPFEHPSLKKPIAAGVRIVKGFKFFNLPKEIIQKVQEDYFAEILDRYSIEGHVIASVDPIDFITMSPVDGRWHSCSDVVSDYRTAPLSYMADSSTILLYIESTENDTYIKDLKQKAWRMVAYASDDMKCVAFAPQYGISHFDSYAENEHFINFLDEVFGNEGSSMVLKTPVYDGWVNPVKANTRYYSRGNVLTPSMISIPIFNEEKENVFELKEYKVTALNNFISNIKRYNYNDIIRKNRLLPGSSVCIRVSKGYRGKAIEVGSDLHCLYPGCRNHIMYPSSFYCFNHSYQYANEGQREIVTCACCGSLMCLDEDVYFFSEENMKESNLVSEFDIAYCDNCFSSFDTCDECGTTITGEVFTDEVGERTLCSYCYEEHWFKKGVK